MPFYGFYDSTYILILIGIGLSMAASGYVKSTYQKYSTVTNQKGYTAAEVAQKILTTSGIADVAIQPISGDLTDNYNAQTKILSLSETVYDSRSVAAIGVAAHECGHAVQDQKHYAPLFIRAFLVPAANIGTTVSIPLILAGILLGNIQWLISTGIFCFAFAFLFQLVTLPVEFNASRRALAILREDQILDNEELQMARKVLFAAALTYVASAVAVFLQLLRLILLFGRRKD